MIEAIVFILIVVYTFRKTFLDDRRTREPKQTPESRPSAATPNRALTAMKNRANDLLRQTMTPEQTGTSGAQGGQTSAVPQTKIAKRRRQQQTTADRSRIHQSLHRKEAQDDAQKAYEAMSREAATAAERVADGVTDYTTIRFDEHELMDEVYDIMACGYPGHRSGQRDFLAEGMALLDRYTL